MLMAFNLKKAIFGDEEDNLSSNVEKNFIWLVVKI